MTAQLPCYTTANIEQISGTVRIGEQSTNSRDYSGQRPMIRLALHSVMKTNGNDGFDWIDIDQLVNELDVYFGSFDICFTVVLRNEIDNDTFHGIETSFDPAWPDLLTHDRVSSAINIYFIPGFAGGVATGFLFEPGEFLVPDLGQPTYPTVTLGRGADGVNTFFTSQILAHEIGHCLGLLHTHELGVCTEEIPRTGPLANCGGCGDFLCDTPADPKLSAFSFGFVDETNCTYTGNAVHNGHAYTPDAKNVMSYTAPSCMQYFSNEQGSRMRSFLLNHSYFDDYVIPDARTVSGIINGDSYYGVETSLYSTAEHTGGTHSYEAGSQIDLQPGFLVEATATNSFSAQIADYSCSTPLVHNHARLQRPQEVEGSVLSARLFPNPASHQSTLRYALQDEARVSIRMVDVLGRERFLMDARQAAGAQELNINLLDYPPGLYYCHLLINGKQQTLPLRVQ